MFFCLNLNIRISIRIRWILEYCRSLQNFVRVCIEILKCLSQINKLSSIACTGLLHLWRVLRLVGWGSYFELEFCFKRLLLSLPSHLFVIFFRILIAFLSFKLIITFIIIFIVFFNLFLASLSPVHQHSPTFILIIIYRSICCCNASSPFLSIYFSDSSC